MRHPIGAPFVAAATADDVIAGIDLTGTNTIVIGGHAGIGLEVTRALAKAGASVTIGARDPERAAAAPGSIDAFAARWLARGRPLHILVNNAGASGGPQRDARGYDTNGPTS